MLLSPEASSQFSAGDWRGGASVSYVVAVTLANFDVDYAVYEDRETAIDAAVEAIEDARDNRPPEHHLNWVERVEVTRDGQTIYSERP